MIDYESLRLVDSGESLCMPSQIYGPDQRTYYLMHTIVKGCGIFRNEYGTFPLRQGQAFFIFPQETTFYQADATNPWYYTWTGWQGIGSTYFLQTAGITREHPVLDLNNFSERIVATIRRICQNATYYSEDAITDAINKDALMHLFSLLAECQRGSRTNTPQQHYARAQWLIDNEQSDNPLTIESLAAAVGLSRSQLFRVFMHICGRSPKDELTRRRCEQAIRLIRETELSLDNIAVACCFSSAAHLCDTFRHAGYAKPSSYRK